MLVDVNVKVSKEASELADGIVSFVKDVKKALDDGWQPGQDLAAVLTAVMADIIPAIQGVDKLGAEKVENMEAFVSAFTLAGTKLAFLLLGGK